MIALNKKIATTPFPKAHVNTVMNKGIVMLEQSNRSLTSLTVIFGNESFPTGSTVYVTSDSFKQAWSEQKFKLNDKEFIFVPEEQILLVDYKS